MKKFLLLSLCLLLAVVPALAADMPFADVPADAWYYDDVANAAAAGLIAGKSADTFAPDDNLTCAEAAKLAAALHQQYTEGEITLENGDPWYQPYVDYMDELFFPFEYDWNAPATRAEFMEIFACALPAAELEAINDIPFGSIPDVPVDHPQAGAIYRLYRAGVAEGSDGELNGAAASNLCKPDDTILRSEAAAILTRMTDKDSRVSVSLAAVSSVESPEWTFEGAGTLVIRQDCDEIPWAAMKKFVTEIRVEDGVTEIPENAFLGFRFAESVTLPASLKTIGEAAFANCQSLEAVEIPDGVESIGAEAFSHCASLKKIELPDSVTEIGDHAFSKCYDLEEAKLPASLKEIPADLFFDCAALKAVTLPEDAETIGERAFCRTAITSIRLPVSVTAVEEGAFEDCADLFTVFYNGTNEQWNAIRIADNNKPLTSAMRRKG